MNSQDIRNLHEAYMDVVENQQLDEYYKRFPKERVFAKQENIDDRLENPKKRISKSNRLRLDTRWSSMDTVRQDMNRPDSLNSQHTPSRSIAKSRANKNRPESEKRSKTVEPIRTFPNRLMRGGRIHDSYDLYDLVLSHLLDEGFADTQEAAEAIMVNMSEEWRQSILG